MLYLVYILFLRIYTPSPMHNHAFARYSQLCDLVAFFTGELSIHTAQAMNGAYRLVICFHLLRL